MGLVVGDGDGRQRIIELKRDIFIVNPIRMRWNFCNATKW